MIAALVYLGMGLIAFLGWAALIVVGIIALRRHQPTLGYVLGGIGVLWAAGSVITLVLLFSYARGHQQASGPRDFDPRTYQGKTTKLQVGDLGDGYLEGYEQGQRYRFKPGVGTVTLPVGANLTSCLLTGQVDQTRWEARSQLSGVAVAHLKTGSHLGVGPPFTTRIVVSIGSGQKSEQVSLSLQTTDRGGHPTILSATPSGAPPAFEARDSQGDLVWSGRFSYG